MASMGCAKGCFACNALGCSGQQSSHAASTDPPLPTPLHSAPDMMHLLMLRSATLSKLQYPPASMTQTEPPSADTIRFPNVDPEAEPGDYGSKDEPSPYVQLDDPLSAIEGMIGKADIVIPKPSIRVGISYPLRQLYTFELRADDGRGFRRGELALKVSQLYQSIYDEEAMTAEDLGREGSLYNRGRSEGKYGIWGHDLGDLAMHSVEYDAEEDMYVPIVDS